MENNEGKTTIAIILPIELDNQLRLLAASQRTSKSEIVRQAIAEYLNSKTVNGPEITSGGQEIKISLAPDPELGW